MYNSRPKQNTSELLREINSNKLGIRIMDSPEYTSALQFSKNCFRLTHDIDPKWAAWADQLYRSAGSIGANLIEGKARGTDGFQLQGYRIARGSAYEALHWLLSAPADVNLDPALIDELKEVIQHIENENVALCQRKLD